MSTQTGTTKVSSPNFKPQVRTEHLPSFASAFSSFVNDPTFSDITIGVGPKNEPLYAHRVVLCTQSPYFREFCEKDFKEGKNSKVELKYMTREATLIVLRYLYTLRVENLSEDNWVLVVELCRLWQVPTLADVVEQFAIQLLDVNNAETFAEIATRFNCRTLLSQSVKRFSRCTLQVVGSRSFIKTNRGVLHAIYERDDLRASEIDLFRALLRWGTNQLVQRGKEVTKANLRDILVNDPDNPSSGLNLLKVIRFGNMTGKEVNDIVKPAGVLLPEELYLLITDCLLSHEKGYQRQSDFSAVPRVISHIPTLLDEDGVLRVEKYLVQWSPLLGFRPLKPAEHTKVLVYAAVSSKRLQEIYKKLTSGGLRYVTTMNGTDKAFPDVNDVVNTYDVVMAVNLSERESEKPRQFREGSTTIGNKLADVVRKGCGVVVSVHSLFDEEEGEEESGKKKNEEDLVGIHGMFRVLGMSPLAPTKKIESEVFFDYELDECHGRMYPSHPLHSDLSYIAGSNLTHFVCDLSEDSEWAGTWNDGTPLFGVRQYNPYKQVTEEYNNADQADHMSPDPKDIEEHVENKCGVVVAVNMQPMSSDVDPNGWNPESDGGRAFANACRYAAAREKGK